MRSWLRTSVAWLVLGVTLLTLPAGASRACACARMASAETSGYGDAHAKTDCPRCASATTSRAATISRAPCCKSKTTDVRAGTTPAPVQLDRKVVRAAAPAHPAPAATTVQRAPARTTRAPPRSVRDPAAPPASYLSDYLRL